MKTKRKLLKLTCERQRPLVFINLYRTLNPPTNLIQLVGVGWINYSQIEPKLSYRLLWDKKVCEVLINLINM